MRFVFVIWFLLFVWDAANGQEKRPFIVGQKSLSTDQGRPLTVQLTDLFVEEQSAGGGDQGGDSGGSDNDHDGGDNDGGNNDDASLASSHRC